MGKLNYSARKISDVKAGQVVSKDLKKRIPPGLGSKAAARDPTLEIDLTGKCLTDEGFAQFIDDLIKCIRYRDEDHPVGLAKVTEFHLQGNKLTVHSLAKIGDVIANSPGDLRELDLSQNDIQVSSPEEKVIWKAFLGSFRNCYMLKKLDLSENPIGTAGLEILARIYIKSDLEFLEADADAIVRENHGEEVALAEEVAALKVGEKENGEPRTGRSKKLPNKSGKAAKQSGPGSSAAAAASKSISFADLKKYACTRGLRSVPYFILSDLALKNSSAVHLSCMLATQRASEQLLTFLPPGKASAIPGSAQDDKSLIWQPNEGFTDFAKRFIDMTESIREFKSKDRDSDGERYTTDEEDKRKLESNLALLFTRLAKRVRIETLKQEGVHASDIAVTALRMMVVSRALLLEDKDRPVEELSEEQESKQEGEEGVRVEEEEEEEKKAEENLEDKMQEQEDEGGEKEPPCPVECHPEPQSTLSTAGPFHPGGIFFDEQFPALQPAHLEQALAIAPTPEPEEKGPLESCPGPESSTEHPSPSTRVGTGPGPEAGTASASGNPTRSSSGKGISRGSIAQKARKSDWRFELPFELWRRIIADVVGADGILDQEQQTSIMHYASDWEAVAYELTIKGAEDHQQIWKFLETVRCFTYTALP
ncbi:hypothetical protein BJX76DRAFT_351904 [Aspergillus varians]